MNPLRTTGPILPLAVAFLLLGGAVPAGASAVRSPAAPLEVPGPRPPTAAQDSAVGNFSQALNRIVVLLGAAGGAILAIAWVRVALSWFSNDVTKKVQAKDRARDALIGTVIFAAALSGLIWGLAQWVLTGT
ncbi:MAG TPA: hypothetical protein VLY85_01195 [Thermoplasmata archaeon]|nr:hypothetical protein [Thermoplasmata archaeon]